MNIADKNRRLAIIPAFNEEERIGPVLREICNVDREIEVVVIDDGSTDQTAETSKGTGAKVLRLSSNMGYGVAIQTGYKYALERGYECVVQLDADGQHDPVYIPKMFAALMSGNTDLIVGSRFKNETPERGKSPSGYTVGKMRRLGIGVFAFISSKLIGTKITDPTSGYRALNRDVLRFLVKDFFPYDYPDADMIVLLHRAGYKIKELSMAMHGREDGTSMHSGLTPVYYVFKMFLSMVMTLVRKNPL